MLDVTPDDIANLNDVDLRALVGRLCETDVRSQGYSTSGVTWGGSQDASDGGIDVRVVLPNGVAGFGYLPRSEVGIQVKKTDMTPGSISSEMRPRGELRPSIKRLADAGGAYIIVSSGSNTSDSALEDRRLAMTEALSDLSNAESLLIDFYDRSRLATWVRNHAGIIPWVLKKSGKPISGWRPYEAWAYSPEGVDDEYLTDEELRLHEGSTDKEGEPAFDGINKLRRILCPPRGVVRLAGLSGVGKTRLVQALFDDRVGEMRLDPSTAIYTDMIDSPEPQPTAMASDLIAMRMQAVVVVDNCPADLHRRLSEVCRQPQSSVSVITVEYDIREDSQEGTDSFILEPSSTSLIEQLIRKRFSNISPVDAATIARSSGGNARVAIALANTLGKNETISSLTDDDLFCRLFYQRNAPDQGLLIAAQACSLVYSFQGETLSGEDAELPILASIAGMKTDELFRHVSELRRRDLVQARGAWRAVLPHAIANRLAALAFENFPIASIESALQTQRLLKSFARRIGYLADNSTAQSIAKRWLEAGNLLGDVSNLNEFGWAVFEYIAPTAPEAALCAIERAVGLDEHCRKQNGICQERFASLLRFIAYEDEYFKRSVGLLASLAESEVTNQRYQNKNITRIFESLFTIYLSGTHTPIEKRCDLVGKLLQSELPNRRSLGIRALEQLLRTDDFISTRPFDFGSRPRDYGFWPTSNSEVRHWFKCAIKLVESFATSDDPVSPYVRSALAKAFGDLWNTGWFLEDLERLAYKIQKFGFWQEGWIAVKKTVIRCESETPNYAEKRILALERLLRPKTTTDRVRAVVLSEAWGELDYADTRSFDEPNERDAKSRLDSAERAEEEAEELGELASEELLGTFEGLVSDLVCGKGARLFSFGRGLARRANNPRNNWLMLVAALGNVPEDDRNVGCLCGFLTGLYDVNPSLSKDLLEEAVNHGTLGTYFPVFQTCIPIDSDGMHRLQRSVELCRAPIWRYRCLANGRYPDDMPGSEFKTLLLAIAAKPGGHSISANILSMRIYSDRQKSKPLDPRVIETGRELLQSIEFERSDQMQDHSLCKIAHACLADAEGAKAVLPIFRTLAAAGADPSVLTSDFDQLLGAVFVVQPRAALDAFFGGNESERKTGLQLISTVCLNHGNPLDRLADEMIIEWCNEEAELRFPLIARAVSYERSSEDAPLQWRAIALELLERAPDPVGILTIFVKRLSPMMWSGSRASIIEERGRLLDDLKGHKDPAVAEFANQKRLEIAAEAERTREWETRRDKARDESFE